MKAKERDIQAYNDAMLVGSSDALCTYLKNYPNAIYGKEAAVVAEYLRPGRVFRDCESCPKMVVVEAGSYLMGSPHSEKGHSPTEEPIHQVTIDDPIAVEYMRSN